MCAYIALAIAQALKIYNSSTQDNNKSLKNLIRMNFVRQTKAKISEMVVLFM